MKTKSFFRVLFILLFNFIAFSCGIKKAADAIGDLKNSLITTIDNSISKLSSESADWRQEASDISDQVTELLKDSKDEVLQTIKGDIINTVNRLPASIGAEFRCDADFLRNRLRQELQRIKAKLLGNSPPELEPILCTVVPSGVVMELKPNFVEFFGYDLDRQKNVKVYLKNGFQKIDVTAKLSQPSHYHWVLNVGPNGVPFAATSNEILVQFGDKEVSSIPVIQPKPKICESVTRVIQNLNTIDYTPPRVSGDKEFAGHGPNSYASINIKHDKTKIWATVFMEASEWCDNGICGDKSKAKGHQDFQLWSAPVGFEIESINSQTSQSAQYIDTNHDPDEIRTGGELVEYFKFIGDTSGDEAGTRTKVSINFKQLSVTLKEKSDCVSKNAILNLPANSRTFMLQKINTSPELKATSLKLFKNQQ